MELKLPARLAERGEARPGRGGRRERDGAAEQQTDRLGRAVQTGWARPAARAAPLRRSPRVERGGLERGAVKVVCVVWLGPTSCYSSIPAVRPCGHTVGHTAAATPVRTVTAGTRKGKEKP